MTYEGNYTHAFICVEGWYYDAERPLGVQDWADLPIFRRFSFEERFLFPLAPDEFKEYWEVE